MQNDRDAEMMRHAGQRARAWWRKLGGCAPLLALPMMGHCHNGTRHSTAHLATARAIGAFVGAIAQAAASSGTSTAGEGEAEAAPDEYRPATARGAAPAPAPARSAAPAPLAPQAAERPALTRRAREPVLASGKRGWIKRCGSAHYLVYDCPDPQVSCYVFRDDGEGWLCATAPCYEHEPAELTAWCAKVEAITGAGISPWTLRQPE